MTRTLLALDHDGLAPHRPRTRWAGLAIAALLALIAGVVIGRSTAPTPPPPPPAPPPAAAGPTSPGPTRVQDGVPVGYARTREGAVSAATQYAVLLGSERLFDETGLPAAISVIAVPNARQSLTAQLGQDASLMRDRLRLTPDVLSRRGVVVRGVPAGYRVVSYGDSASTIAVWGVGIFAVEGRQPVGPSWSTSTMELRWVEGDWKLAKITTAAGPTPPGPGDPQSTVVGQQIEGFQEYLHVPGK